MYFRALPFKKGVRKNNINFMYDDSGLGLISYGVLYCNHFPDFDRIFIILEIKTFPIGMLSDREFSQ